LASLDGVVMPAAQARVPATDDGLLRGDGVFEVARVYAGRVFALAEHLVRLERSAANLRLPVDAEALAAEGAALLQAAPGHDGLLRIVCTRGGVRLLLLEPLPARPATARVGYVTYAPTRVLDQVKSLSYAGNMLSTRMAQERGFDEALLVTPHGRVLEGPTWSLFWVKDGELMTPPLTEHVLDSITRRMVLEEAGGSERVCTREDLAAAEEAFIASTVREAMPIATVEDRDLPAAPGPVTAAAGAALRARIERELSA